MIVSNASIISVQGGTFRALWCGVLYSEKSWISINDAKICNSTVTVLPPGVRREHLALVKLVTSTLNLKNSTISNNTRSVILLAKHCNISIDKSSISENVATFSVVLFVKTYTNITDGNMFKNRGSFLFMNSFVKFYGNNAFTYCKQSYNESIEHHLQPEGTITSIHSSINIINGTTSFLENHSERSGSALHSSASEISVRGKLIVANNTADDSGRGAYLYLTEFICYGNCNFVNNQARKKGGGICASSSQIILRSESIWRNSQCNCSLLEITNNTAQDGGGICLEMNSRISGLGGHDYVYNIVFTNNTALQNGGAIFVDDGSYSGTCNSTSSTRYLTKTECFLQTFNTDYVRSRQPYHHHMTFRNNLAKAGAILYGGLLDRCTVNIVADVYMSTHHDHAIDGLTYFMNESGLSWKRLKIGIKSHPVQYASAFVKMI